jgi:pimeloyl-ACP methyl ester carboxylesterase
MMSACVAIIATVTSAAGLRDHPPLLKGGGDTATGMLVNWTVGARPADPPDPRRPTLVFIHGFNPAPRIVHFTMSQEFATALGRRCGSAINVLGWEWNAATVVGLHPRWNHESAVHQGHRLAAALRGAGLDPGRIQLIGHSSGTIVATAAGRVFANSSGSRLAQLTLLEPATYYHGVLFDRLAAGSAALIVENYWIPGPSAYGRAVSKPGVRSFQVASRSPYFGVVCPLRSDHLYIVHWYLGTIADPTCPSGFNVSRLLVSRR